MGGKDVDISKQGVSCNAFCAHVAKSSLFFHPNAFSPLIVCFSYSVVFVLLFYSFIFVKKT